MQIPFEDLFAFSAVLISICLIAFLQIAKSNKIKSNNLLTIYIAAIGFLEFESLITRLNFDLLAYILLPFYIGAVFLFAPIQYLYFNSFALNKEKISVFRHFVPAISTALIVAVFAVSGRIFHYEEQKSLAIKLVVIGLIIAFLIQNCYYIFNMFKLIKQHARNVSDFFSYKESISLNWLKKFFLGYIALIAGIVIIELIKDYVSYAIFDSLMIVYICYGGYWGFKQNTIYPKEVVIVEAKEEKKNTSKENPENYASSSLKNEDQIADIKQKILDYMEKEKPFLDSKFNMFDFSRALGINYKYISQVINEEFGKNFIVFINERRVEEAKKLLLDDKNKYLSVEEIAIQAGFQTPSTFYVNFKKYTSTTPSNYRLRTN